MKTLIALLVLIPSLVFGETYPIRYPDFIRMNQSSFYIVLGIFVAFMIFYYVIFKYVEKLQTGLVTNIFCSLFVLTFLVMCYEGFNNKLYFVDIFNSFALFHNILLVITLFFAIYAFCIIVLYSYYKLKYKNEMTSYTYSLLKWIDEVRKEIGV